MYRYSKQRRGETTESTSELKEIKDQISSGSWGILQDSNSEYILKYVSFIQIQKEIYVYSERGSEKRSIGHQFFQRMNQKNIKSILKLIIDASKQAHSIGMKVRNIFHFIEVDVKNKPHLIKIKKLSDIEDLFCDYKNRDKLQREKLDRSEIKVAVQVLQKIIIAKHQGNKNQLFKIKGYKKDIGQLSKVLQSTESIEIDELQKKIDRIMKIQWQRKNILIEVHNRQKMTIKGYDKISAEVCKEIMLFLYQFLKNISQFDHSLKIIEENNYAEEKMNEMIKNQKVIKCINKIQKYLSPFAKYQKGIMYQLCESMLKVIMKLSNLLNSQQRLTNNHYQQITAMRKQIQWLMRQTIQLINRNSQSQKHEQKQIQERGPFNSSLSSIRVQSPKQQSFIEIYFEESSRSQSQMQIFYNKKEKQQFYHSKPFKQLKSCQLIFQWPLQNNRIQYIKALERHRKQKGTRDGI